MQLHRLTTTPMDVDALCDEMHITANFDAEVQRAAEAAALRPVQDVFDATDIPLVTIDPPESLDLDQAVAITARPNGGWTVSYAIADVAHFVDPNGPIDVEARQRGETLYAPNRRIPLYPDVLGEGAMSLLPNVERPALLWRIDLDADADVKTYDLRRAIVRSRAKLNYAEVQHGANAGTLPDAIALLEPFGKTYHARGIAHGAIELNLPEQQVDQVGSGWELSYRSPLPVETWNAQVSLLTGTVAAKIMLESKIGILRTLPPAPVQSVQRLKAVAQRLGVEWPDNLGPGQVIASLDLSDPRHVAFVGIASELLRGAGYTAFDGTLPAQCDHAGIGGPYAHVTAPIRRLCDRFGNEVCIAAMAGTPVPDWARQSLVEIGEDMAASGKRAHAFDRAIVDGTEAMVLANQVGTTFRAIVIDSEPRHHGSASQASVAQSDEHGTVMLESPAVTARVDGTDLPLGARVDVRLETADPTSRTVRFCYPAETT